MNAPHFSAPAAAKLGFRALLLTALSLLPSVASVTFEFQVATAPLPEGTLGVLVVDRNGDGFFSLSDSEGTRLSVGEQVGGSDDLIIGVFATSRATTFGNGEPGFSTVVGPLDYQTLNLAPGQPFILYAIPGRSEGDLVRRGETFVSFRTESSSELTGDMTFSLPPNGGLYRLGAVAGDLGGNTDLASLTPSSPLIDFADPEDVIVGKEMNIPIEITGTANRFRVLGLPPGMDFNRQTGLITGFPRRSGTFLLRLWAWNEFGRSGPLMVPFEIAALPENVLGQFEAGVDREQELNDFLGGKLIVRTHPGGALTGRLILGPTSHGFRSVMETNMVNGVPTDPTATIEIPRPRQSPLVLHLSFDANGGLLAGTVSEGANHADLAGHRHFWHFLRQPAIDYVGAYNAVIDLDGSQSLDGDLSVPQGNGFLRSVAGRHGITRLIGRLSDNTPFSTSAILSETGDFLVFVRRYGARGSILGSAAISSNTEEISGAMDWVKQAVDSPGVRLYPDGFGTDDPVRLLVGGSIFIPPSPEELLAGFQDMDPNASLQFFEGMLDDTSLAPDVDFTLRPGGHGRMPAFGGDDNPARTTFRLNPRTGLFIGSFFQRDTVDGYDRPFTKRVPYWGLWIPNQGNGAGYFLNPELPAPRGTSSIPPYQTPIHSGQVILSPAS